MTHINSTVFGSITIDGEMYHFDVIILSNGKILKRIGPRGSHEICLEEFSRILKSEPKPKTIIIGTGQSGVAEIESNVGTELKNQGIEIIEARTPEAIKIFNITKDPKAGLFHVTC